ncbi:MAG: hypothetical protein ISR84_03470 [Kiritimatiellales bacterium]|nr:hypothetical protein [Kiritimatiellales bacterium]
MKSLILKELKHHGPFTLVGALGSVAAMMLLRHFAPEFLTTDRAADWFEFTHPMHVVLSAMVTASLYRNYRAKAKHSKSGTLAVILVGYFGSIGIATLSDCLIPHWGELLMGMHACGGHSHAHIGIIEMPYIINFAALFGISVAYWQPKTYFPHAGHVLLSMAASLFHILRAQAESFSILEGVGIALFLFVAVWIPCCLSDIVFPLLFIKKEDLPDDLHIH